MKICLYNVTTTIKTGGIETFNWEMGNVLSKNNEVEIIGGKGAYIKYPQLNYKIFPFAERKDIINLGSRFKKFGERISFFKNAYSYLKKQNYDLVVLSKPLDFFSAYFFKKWGAKVAFVSGGEDFYGFDKFFVKYIDYMFAVSEDNKKIIQNRYNRKVKILPNGVNLDLFKKDLNEAKKLKEKFNLTQEKVLLSVGRLVALKGYQDVIKILPYLKDVKYLIVGKGEYLENLKKLAKELRVENKVLFVGEVRHNELYKYYSLADLFIQPTLTKEAFGITLIEALACEVPVVARNVGGMKEIIKNNINGFLFENDLVEKITMALNYNFTDLRSYARNYSWDKSAKILLNEVYFDFKEKGKLC